MTVNESRTSGGLGGAREGEDRLDFSALDPTRDAAARPGFSIYSWAGAARFWPPPR